MPPTTPGLYLDDAPRSPKAVFAVGIPAFLSVRPFAVDSAEAARWAELGASAESRIVRMDAARFSRFEENGAFAPTSKSYLSVAVRGFFQNGGRQCYLVAPFSGGLSDMPAQLEALDAEDGFDLLCAPDLVQISAIPSLVAMQAEMLRFCQTHGDCFAILDSLRCPGIDLEAELGATEEHCTKLMAKLATDGIDAANAALYMPWLKLQEGANSVFVPPSGHIAGVYARTDRTSGVHKAPANEVIEGVFDVELRFTAADQERLYPERVNCVRVFPGRGMRVWGARTLSADPAWAYVNQRRVLLTVRRWLEKTMASVVFEPNDLALWIRIRREVNAFLSRLFEAGALRGRTPGQAFYVKCDAETNPPQERAAGRVVTEIGLALEKPSEFVVARIVYGSERTTGASSSRVGS